MLTADFVCEQQYNMGMRALLNSSLRTYGIASGLEVVWQPGSDQVRVGAGMAIDRLGRQIVLAGAQVLRLADVTAREVVYLTIRYHEVYADYSVESGVPGYKRIVQQPLIEYLPTLQDPGINILLAIVNFSTQGGVDTLSFKLGQNERRYVGSRLGVVELVTEGNGIRAQNGAMSDVAGEPFIGIRMLALREDGSQSDYLDVQARRSQFDGMLTTRDSLGVGIDQPQATLQVQRIVAKGVGTLTTRGRLLTLQSPLYPSLQVGDVIIPELPVGTAALVPRQAVVERITGEGQYQIEQAFQQDILLPCRFSYIRMTLVRFTAGDVGEVLSIDGQGKVELGVRSAVQSGTPGPAALQITSGRRVGIGLTSDVGPQAALDVNGSVLADSLTCTGAVKAQSFEGNGSKLQNLPILSYWTKQDVTATYSSIYYASGNVGVQALDPPASLTVGTGPGFIGSGTVTADSKDIAKLNGFQTAFKSQVGYGDCIVLGSLMQQAHQIRTITSNTTLELTDQFATILQKSAYKFRVNGSSEAKPGNGTISSSGTVVTGTDPEFTKNLRSGDWLVVDQFKPDTVVGYQRQWVVDEVIDDITLIVINKSGNPLPANISAYMVVPTLMGMFRSNVDSAVPAPPPAMLLQSNGPDWQTNKLAANTVGINAELDELDPKYSLQVNGDVNFSGSSNFNQLGAKRLTVTEWASITGAGNGGTVLMVGPTSSTPLLSVTQSNVVIGPTAGAGTSMLEVSGDANATGNIIAAKQLQGASVKVTGAVSAGSLEAKSMDVSGVQVDEGGNVALFGARVQIGISSSSPIQSQVAKTDGFIVATLYPNGNPFAGSLTCTTSTQQGGNAISYYASASTTSYITSSEKGGTSSVTIQQSTSLCVPVRNGELWRLQFSFDSRINPANIQAYWVPLGPGNSQMLNAMAAGTPTQPSMAAAPAFDPATQLVHEIRSLPVGGGAYGQGSSLADAQREIDQRVGDLTQILGDATNMPADQAAREDFIQKLQKIVCSASPPGTQPHNRVDPKLIADLIDTFARITKLEFTSTQKALLALGVRALVAINDNEKNRNDLNLIRNNINIFQENLQKATGITLDNGQRRLMTRALVRLVGNGTQDPNKVGSDAPSV
ncbi:hypothetical protein B1992_00075 [Pseudoxanthomonas broegbernensis]|uniref:Uncharacterized protein n=1 Tax=Pseudoxanthomonas broegbernensis TaxID=83619 RepID=A0A7V8K8J5_9GAMM|nr:hypothetical protein B1992_00075 [Pseudoxanthomonas broegbernensis]